MGGMTDGREKVFEEWKNNIRDLSKCPNMNVKLSGLAMIVCGFDFHNYETPPKSDELAKAWGPYILHCIKCFGVERCMFASNFPVDKVSCTYTSLWNAFKIITKDFSSNVRKALFHDNAKRIY